MSKIYISGRISGKNLDNVREEFQSIEDRFKANGYEVVNPLKNGLPENAPWERHIAMDIILLLGCDEVFFLRDWRQSKGATIEHGIAELTGKEIRYQEQPKLGYLKDAIEAVLGIGYNELLCRSKNRRYVNARMHFVHHCISVECMTFEEAAREIGRDDSTTRYYTRMYDQYYATDNVFREEAEKIKKFINNEKTKKQ